MDSGAFQILNRIARVEKHLRKCSTKCLCPTCKNPAIRSHAVQKNGWLSSISENGHVMGVPRQIAANLYQSSPDNPPVSKIERIGLNEASTFWGYCNSHDTQLFDCIERQPLCKNNTAQAMALHLRAMSFERVAKRSQLEIYRCLSESHRDPIMREFLKNEVCIREQMFDADLRYRWNLFWSDNNVAQFSREFSFRWVVIPKNIGVASVAMIPPMSAVMEDRYMTAHKHEDGTYDVGRPSFSLSVIPDGQDTHVVMCWHNDDGDYIAAWRNELCSGDSPRMSQFLNRCIFEKSEDYYLRPSFWCSLTNEVREDVIRSLTPHSGVYEPPAVVVL